MFTPTPITHPGIQAARERYLASLAKDDLGVFMDELQIAAGTQVNPDERDHWFNYQLTRLFMDASQWSDALVAVEDALTVAIHEPVPGWEKLFAEMRKEIVQHLK
jgi:hypothetical protein